MKALVAYFLLAVTVSSLCSLLEAVLLSTSDAYVGLLCKQGRRSGTILANLKRRTDRPLAAILTLNTIANTVGAAGVGAQAFHVWGERWVALASGVLTFCILVFSEIIPKTVGATYWRTLAPFSARVIRVLMVITWPVVSLTEILVRFLSRGKKRILLTREELIIVAEQGEIAGALQQGETRVIKNLVRLDKVVVEEVMTPRAVVMSLPANLTVGEVLARHRSMPFTRIPIYGEGVDDIRGIVHRYRILEAHSEGKVDITLERLARPIHRILETRSVASALDEFIQRREHTFLVVDEYGGTSGLISLEDAVETLLGVEIVDEFDSVDDMRKLARARWEQRQREQELGGKAGGGEGD